MKYFKKLCKYNSKAVMLIVFVAILCMIAGAFHLGSLRLFEVRVAHAETELNILQPIDKTKKPFFEIDHNETICEVIYVFWPEGGNTLGQIMVRDAKGSPSLAIIDFSKRDVSVGDFVLVRYTEHEIVNDEFDSITKVFGTFVISRVSISDTLTEFPDDKPLFRSQGFIE